MRNGNLEQAKRVKNDEFYTRRQDIEAELVHWRDTLQGKSVLCNCNDFVHTGFLNYFSENFDALGLKKLVCTEYSPGAEQVSVCVRTMDSCETVLLAGDGDFRSKACMELMEQADIVITNPPFSLFREFVQTLATWGGRFLIIGSMNAVTYGTVFRMIQTDTLWLGHTKPKVFNTARGWQKFGNICWFTNLDKPERHEKLLLHIGYSEADNPSYVNYPAIEVARVAWIPCDYDGEMGVPISFLEQYCPEQFRIVGFSGELARPMEECVPDGSDYVKGGPRFYLKSGENQYKRCYDRIVIQRIDV